MMKYVIVLKHVLLPKLEGSIEPPLVTVTVRVLANLGVQVGVTLVHCDQKFPVLRQGTYFELQLGPEVSYLLLTYSHTKE